MEPVEAAAYNPVAVRGGNFRIVFAAALVALLALALAACGGDEDGTTQSTASAPAEPAGGGERGDREAGSDSDQSGDKASGKPDGGALSASPPGSADAAAQRESGGGAEQFRVPGGDNSIQEFGAEASDAEREEAAAVLRAFLAAHAARDWATLCSHLSQRMRDQLEQLIAGSPELKGKGCEAAVDAILADSTAAERAELTQADVGSLRVEGERAFILYHGARGRDYSILLEREDGAWKASALLPTTFPEAG